MSDASDVLTECAFVCISLLIFLVVRYAVTAVVCMFHISFDVCKCDVFVCFDVCGVFVECSLFLWSLCVGCCDLCLICEA